jgi:hypothetical protein
MPVGKRVPRASLWERDLCDCGFGAGGYGAVVADGEDGVSILLVHRGPVHAGIGGDVGAGSADGDPGFGVEGGDSGAELLGGFLRREPRRTKVVGVEERCLRDGRIFVVAAYGDDRSPGAVDGKDTSRGGAVKDERGCDGPGAAVVGGVEYAGGGAAGGEEDVFVIRAAEDEGGVAGGEDAFGGECGRLGGFWELSPVLAVFGVEDGEFVVDGIADGEADFFGAADEAVEEEGGARIGILCVPGFAGVGGFVDVGLVVVADGEDVGDVGAEVLDAAEVRVVGVADVKAGPGFAGVGGAEDDSVGAGGVERFAVGGRGEAAEAGVVAGVEGLLVGGLWEGGEEGEKEERKDWGAHWRILAGWKEKKFGVRPASCMGALKGRPYKIWMRKTPAR